MISRDEKLFKELIFFLNSVENVIIDAVDEGRLRGNLKNELLDALNEIKISFGENSVNIEKLKKSLATIYNIAKLFFDQLEYDEKDMFAEYVGPRSDRNFRKILDNLERLVSYDKVKNTIYSFAEEITQELNEGNLEELEKYSNISKMKFGDDAEIF